MIDILDGKEVQGPLFTEHQVITSRTTSASVYPDIAPCEGVAAASPVASLGA